MVLTIRPAEIHDATTATALLNAIIRTGGTTALQTEMSPPEATNLFLCSDYVACCQVADWDGALIGFQSVGRNPKMPENWGDMARFAAEGATGKGLGTALFQATLVAARAQGLTHLNATIRADNTSGLTYYSRMGFADYAIDAAVPLADGTPVDRVKKQLTL
jgi:L-amino acid N-acyltransferase YncA